MRSELRACLPRLERALLPPAAAAASATAKVQAELVPGRHDRSQSGVPQLEFSMLRLFSRRA